MQRSRGNRNTYAKIEARRAKAVKFMNEGMTKTELAEQLRISRATLWRDLASLRERYKSENSEEFEAYRKAQLGILEQIEGSIVQGIVSPDFANAWRQVRSDIDRRAHV